MMVWTTDMSDVFANVIIGFSIAPESESVAMCPLYPVAYCFVPV
ncbi:MAG: hypothetical protein Q9M43_07300 [Sulfurimonas sp.]|nr:hypothetical protein [Sulfurimonas sp.]